MNYPVRADIIPLFRCLVEAIRPFADAHSVAVRFNSEQEALEAYYHPAELLPGLCRLLCRVVTFTPQSFEVLLEVRLEESALNIQVRNTGANLTYLDEIQKGLDFPVKASALKKGGTLFDVRIPLGHENASVDSRKKPEKEEEYDVPVFYKKLRSNLQAYSASIQNMERAAAARNQKDGVFLQKVNAIISANLSREGFDIDALSKALALSRSQLYRKLKELIRLSPSQYIRFTRLQKAKELLETTEMTIGEVAFQAGFVDKSHFSRVFKKQFGFNPSYLRKSSEKGVN
ncbi:MAG: helix-turn-helix transcriptional regulator [Lewinellaceae bacterium]|nr:helix-turn-helix transcriptional regulator [Lewinellaceae bacterium]